MSCEPEARINLFAQLDTVYARTADEIARTPSTEEAAFEASGENPILYSAVQSVKAGIQTIRLEMSYETFSTTDGDNQEIEMPYLKFENVSVGELSMNERATKSVIKTDTAFYDVQVPVRLDVIQVGTADENRQTLEFVVAYVGAVVTEMELSDPVKALSDTIKVLGGTGSTSSPFRVELGDTLDLLFAQNSSYTDSYGNRISCHPEARIHLLRNSILFMFRREMNLKALLPVKSPCSNLPVTILSGIQPSSCLSMERKPYSWNYPMKPIPKRMRRRMTLRCRI